MCEEKAMSIATVISNNKATEVMAEHTYDEIFTIEKDKNGISWYLSLKKSDEKCNKQIEQNKTLNEKIGK